MRNKGWYTFFASVIGLLALAAVADNYVVKSGDTLDGIAYRNGVSVQALIQANHLERPDRLSIGQKLFIPSPSAPGLGGKQYTVVQGDSLGSIAADNGVSVIELANLNQLDDPNRLAPGQVLQIPVGGSASAAASRYPMPAAAGKVVAGIRVTPGKWRYIVIHHSATKVGSAQSMDLYHRRVRHMENGLAYHFVIGNGRGMKDGEIFVGNRWKKQLNGGHMASEALNAKSIGICLVGNFETGVPTVQQMRSLYALVDYLDARCRIAPSAVKASPPDQHEAHPMPRKEIPRKDHAAEYWLSPMGLMGAMGLMSFSRGGGALVSPSRHWPWPIAPGARRPLGCCSRPRTAGRAKRYDVWPSSCDRP